MSSREQILSVVKQNQPPATALPVIVNYPLAETNLPEKLMAMLTGIGATVVAVPDVPAIIADIKERFATAKRMVAMHASFSHLALVESAFGQPHGLEDVDVAILQPHFAVAENGAAWITEDRTGERVLPFICQHLVLIIEKENIVATMHDAYDVIGQSDYGYGAFIAGPSKTADIEQSLVLGAHGPLSMCMYMVG